MLLRIPEHPKEADKVNSPSNGDYAASLMKVMKLLTRFETKLEDCQLSNEELIEVVNGLKTIQNKTDSILNAVREYTGKSQQDLFTGSKDT
jgi:hypothetical protein